MGSNGGLAGAGSGPRQAWIWRRDPLCAGRARWAETRRVQEAEETASSGARVNYARARHRSGRVPAPRQLERRDRPAQAQEALHARPTARASSFSPPRAQGGHHGGGDDLSALCARHLVASNQGGVSSPVAAAVPAAGYLSEDTDGGGSIREVELEYAETEDGPSSYTHDGRWTGRRASPRPLIV
ncbi:hypothetical protein B0H14DRAFT_3579161 [Mycena olivaceomarginata]|nr:hypothetical protein B0H14DRAFT_3579161 [Mycena olivaceomarginata]